MEPKENRPVRTLERSESSDRNTERPGWQRIASRVLHAVDADPYDNFFEDRTGERLLKLLSPRYVKARVKLALYERRYPDVPWIARDVVEMLDDHLDGRQVGLEWGSGKGTLWLLERSKWLTSVEHHRAWYENVKARLDAAGVNNADYRLVEEKHYLRAIDEIPPGSLDYVIVDGLFRDEATWRSMPKLKSGGWLVIDNVNWYLPSASETPQSRTYEDGPRSELWGSIGQKLASWEMHWMTNGVNDTSVFVKP